MSNSLEKGLRQSELIIKYLNGKLTDNESIELHRWIEADEANEVLFQELTNTEAIRKELLILDQFGADEGKLEFKRRLRTLNKPIQKTINPLWKYVAAASVVFLVSIVWFAMNRDQKEMPKSPEVYLKMAESIQPGSDKAVLTTADGKTIELTEKGIGSLPKRDSMNVVFGKGELRYASNGIKNKLQYNTLTTPKGGQYKLVLEDGTKVWLNAASSITFPTAFIGNERKVVLQGEGYFEVASDVSRPFRIETEKGLVEALGTSLNVSTYADEARSKTTLLEGKVLVHSGKKEAVLYPGQQARIGIAGEAIEVVNVDTETEIAWKNGQFVFKSATLQEIMRQLSRWYDIEVRFTGESGKEKFSGIVSRSGNLSEVLRILNEGGVRFRIDNRTIILL